MASVKEDGQMVQKKEKIAVDKQYQVQFSFLSLEYEHKYSYGFMDFNCVKEFGTDIENQAITVKTMLISGLNYLMKPK